MSDQYHAVVETPDLPDQDVDLVERYLEFSRATKPCTGHTKLFFGGHNEYEDGERGGPRKEQMLAAEANSRRARKLCMQCPIAKMRTCAQFALDTDNAWGVWAGVQLPGNQTRKIPVLMQQRELLLGIADGSIDPYTHESNADLFEPHDDQLVLFPTQPDRAPAADVAPVRATA